MRLRQILLMTLLASTFSGLAGAQSPASSVNLPDAPGVNFAPFATTRNSVYRPPTQKVLFRNYAFDLLGPYPAFTSAASGAIHQATNNPREWGQGGAAFGRRFGSSFGISVVQTSTRYALAEAFHVDPLYYYCECKGVLPRVGHAVLSTFTARRGADGRRVLSFPALGSAYAGTFTATYTWYPKRFGAEDALRMGDNTLLSSVGANIAFEFLAGGRKSPLARIHLPIRLGADAQDSGP